MVWQCMGVGEHSATAVQPQPPMNGTGTLVACHGGAVANVVASVVASRWHYRGVCHGVCHRSLCGTAMAGGSAMTTLRRCHGTGMKVHGGAMLAHGSAMALPWKLKHITCISCKALIYEDGRVVR